MTFLTAYNIVKNNNLITNAQIYNRFVNDRYNKYIIKQNYFSHGKEKKCYKKNNIVYKTYDIYINNSYLHNDLLYCFIYEQYILQLIFGINYQIFFKGFQLNNNIYTAIVSQPYALHFNIDMNDVDNLLLSKNYIRINTLIDVYKLNIRKTHKINIYKLYCGYSNIFPMYININNNYLLVDIKQKNITCYKNKIFFYDLGIINLELM